MKKTKSKSDFDAERLNRAVRIWFLTGILILIYISYEYLKFFLPAIKPFLYALAIVYILKPLVEFLQGKRIPRILALIISYLTLIAVIAVFVVFMTPAVIEQSKEFAKEIPKLIDKISDYITKYSAEFERIEFPVWVDSLVKKAGSSLEAMVTYVAKKIPEYGLNFASALANFVLSVFLSFYILKDWQKIKTSIFGFLYSRKREDLVEILQKGNLVISGFVKGQALVALSMGLITATVLYLMGVKYAFFLGMVTGLLDLIPYFGPIVGGLLAFLVAFLESPILAFWVVLVMVAIQQLESIFIAPNIMSKQVELHPALIVLAFFIGGLAFGFIGLLIAIPAAAFAKVVFNHFFSKGLEAKLE